MNLLIIGAPGTGKGTMSNLICGKYGLVHISTGDILREISHSDSELGRLAQSYMSKGLLVPDEVIHELILDRLAQPDIDQGFFFDGYPRTLAQAEDLDTILKKLDKKIDLVIDMQVEDEILIDRITGRRSCPKCKAIYHIKNRPSKVAGICDQCGSELSIRKDDTAESLKERLKAYHESTAPVIDYYKDQGLAISVDAQQSVEDVFAFIDNKLRELND